MSLRKCKSSSRCLTTTNLEAMTPLEKPSWVMELRESACATGQICLLTLGVQLLSGTLFCQKKKSTRQSKQNLVKIAPCSIIKYCWCVIVYPDVFSICMFCFPFCFFYDTLICVCACVMYRHFLIFGCYSASPSYLRQYCKPISLCICVNWKHLSVNVHLVCMLMHGSSKIRMHKEFQS